VTAKNAINLQDYFLNQVRKEGILTTVYLVNGFQLKGVIKGFDSFTVVIDSDGKQMLIYKHAISTITPSRPVAFAEAKEASEEKEDRKDTEVVQE